jgi:hypothetical protein
MLYVCKKMKFLTEERESKSSWTKDIFISGNRGLTPISGKCVFYTYIHFMDSKVSYKVQNIQMITIQTVN